MNQIQLSGVIAERSAMRYTPAGLPAFDLVLHHLSTVLEEGVARRVDLEIKAICIGKTAALVQTMSLGVAANYAGFLTPTRNRKGILFHITDIQINP